MKHVLIVLLNDDIHCSYEITDEIAMNIGTLREKVREGVAKMSYPRPNVRLQVAYVGDPPATGSWEESVVADILSRAEE